MGFELFNLVGKGFFVFYCKPVVARWHIVTVERSVPSLTCRADLLEQFPVAVKYINFGITSNTFYVPCFMDTISIWCKILRIIYYKYLYTCYSTTVLVSSRYRM